MKHSNSKASILRLHIFSGSLVFVYFLLSLAVVFGSLGSYISSLGLLLFILLLTFLGLVLLHSVNKCRNNQTIEVLNYLINFYLWLPLAIGTLWIYSAWDTSFCMVFIGKFCGFMNAMPIILGGFFIIYSVVLVVISLVAVFKCAKGQDFKYPFIFRLIKKL